MSCEGLDPTANFVDGGLVNVPLTAADRTQPACGWGWLRSEQQCVTPISCFSSVHGGSAADAAVNSVWRRDEAQLRKLGQCQRCIPARVLLFVCTPDRDLLIIAILVVFLA